MGWPVTVGSAILSGLAVNDLYTHVTCWELRSLLGSSVHVANVGVALFVVAACTSTNV